MANDAKSVIKSLKKVSDPKRAIGTAGYFKTGKGEYGEGDIFIGVTVPLGRKVAGEYKDLPLSEVQILLKSKIHEHRSVALYILCLQYQAYPEKRKTIFNLYMKNTAHVNNWDLVDTSARDIVGDYIWNYFTKEKREKFLNKLSKSKLLWERRIAVIATHYGISKKELGETLYVSELLISDTHDLMHKAVGWMLRELGKKDREVLVKFLKKHAAVMPRTMLRYSIEHFSPEDRLKYMKMKGSR